MYAAELWSTGNVSTAAFQILSDGNTAQPANWGGAAGRQVAMARASKASVLIMTERPL
jgi:hypothetical protein